MEMTFLILVSLLNEIFKNAIFLLINWILCYLSSQIFDSENYASDQ